MDSRSDGWYIGRDRWDAIIFQPSQNVRIYGIGIYEAHPLPARAFKLGYKYILQTPNDQGGFDDTFTSAIFEEDVEIPPTDEIVDHTI